MNLWYEIYTHSGYSYNLAHAAAYTMISCQMAWYKVYDRGVFTLAVLQYDKANAQTYIIDAIEHGMTIKTPHINHSTSEYSLRGDSIYLPLSEISFLGENSVNAIVKEVQDNGPFESYADLNKRLPKRVCNNRVRGLLERIGGFTGLSGSPTDAINKYEDLPITKHYQTQLEILGYVIPTKTLMEKINKLREKRTKANFIRFAGFVSKVKRKSSAYGDYTVYTLSPFGSFWIRDEDEPFQVGDFVSGTKSVFGHSKDVKRYSIESGE